jgi:uncharacterized protein YgbK (DUF1537 family)
VLTDLPDVREVPGARDAIRAANRDAARRIAVLDDDPTGSQTVHGIGVVTVVEAEAVAAGLAEPGACFVLTNTRSLPEAEAIALTRDAAGMLLDLEARHGGRVEAISRSDSTLRGHVLAEVRALDAVRRERTGRGCDGVLFAPAYFEAGRFTAGDVHYARIDGVPVPVGETEFARDATFGYSSSNLREFLAERSGGALRAEDVLSVGLGDIREGGPDRVAEILAGASGGAMVVVNAMCDEDLDVVVLGLLAAAAAGRTFLHRTGPSFVRALAGVEPRAPLSAAELGAVAGGGHGLVVVGSHVGLTSRQLAAARAEGGLVDVELDVMKLIDPATRDARVAQAAARVVAELANHDVLLSTSRVVVRGADADASLEIARTVSSALVEVVQAARAAALAWVVAKGGITSHDVAVHGLGIRRAEVIGQLLPGMVSVWRTIDAPPEVAGRPYVVFAGNVGDARTLAEVVATLRGGSAC